MTVFDVRCGFDTIGKDGKPLRCEIGDKISNLPANVEADLLKQGVIVDANPPEPVVPAESAPAETVVAPEPVPIETKKKAGK
jgi:hypothetical protein